MLFSVGIWKLVKARVYISVWSKQNWWTKDKHFPNSLDDLKLTRPQENVWKIESRPFSRVWNDTPTVNFYMLYSHIGSFRNFTRGLAGTVLENVWSNDFSACLEAAYRFSLIFARPGKEPTQWKPIFFQKSCFFVCFWTCEIYFKQG